MVLHVIWHSMKQAKTTNVFSQEMDDGDLFVG